MGNHFTQLVPGKLWAGDDNFGCFTLPPEVVKVVTVYTKPVEVVGRVRCYSWLPATDDQPLLPEVIDAAVADDQRLPTYIHCHLGQNRSSALATCWIRRNTAGPTRDLFGDLLHSVLAMRTADLATIGRGKAEVSASMLENVRRYDAWLRERAL